MKKFTIIVLVLLCTTTTFAQNFSSIIPPVQTAEMPSWAKHFYENNDITAINAITIDTAYYNYYKIHKFEKNNWTRYYKRWRRSVDAFVQSDGSIKRRTEAETDALRADYQRNKQQNVASRSSTWQILGPQKTHWLANDVPAQPQCPWQANIYAFDISVSNPSILYAGTETGGLYKTINKGLNWSRIGADFFLETSNAVAINPVNPDTVYTGNDKLYMTANAGASWQTVSAFSGLAINDIKVNPLNSGSVLAGGTAGLYRRNAVTGVWTQQSASTIYDLDFKPGSGSIVYGLRQNGTAVEFIKSTDGGATFTVRPTGWFTGVTDNGGRMSVTVADANKIYVVLLTSGGPRILRSDDAGESWTITASGSTAAFGMTNWQGYYDLGIMVSPNNANHVLVGTNFCFKSLDGGVNFASGTIEVHPDVQEMRAVGNDSWIVTDGGLTYSNDFFTANSAARMEGVDASDFWGFGQGWNEDAVVGGRYHNGNTAWHESYPAGQFLRVGGAEQATGYINPSNARMCYFSDLSEVGRIMPSTFNGQMQSFPVTLVPNESYSTMQTGEMEWDPRNYNTYYVGSGASVKKTTDNGKTSQTLFTSPDAGAIIEDVRVSRANPLYIYATQRINSPSGGKIWRTVDGGLNWTACTATPTSSSSDRRVSAIVVSTTDALVLWVTHRNGEDGEIIYKSIDGGSNWSPMSAGLPSGIKVGDLANIMGTDYIFLACDNGKVFYSNGGAWTAYSVGLPINENPIRIIPFYKGNKLRLASSQGIYEADIPVAVPVKAQIMVDKYTTPCARDTFYFDSYSVAPAGATYNWSFPGAAYVSSTSARNPKVFYGGAGSFDATLTVNGNTQTLVNLISVSGGACDVDTVRGTSLDLSAASNLISIPKISSFAGATSFSFSAWVKPNALQQSFTELVSSHNSNVGFAFGFAFKGYAANTNLTFYWTGVAYQLTTTHDLPLNEWSHVVLTITPTLATIYVNGKPWTRTGSYGGFDFSNVQFDLGTGDPGQGGNFNGFMDEAKFYNYALTQNEVREKMHLLRKGTETGLIAHYQFNEASGTTVYDKVGVAHGAISNTYNRVPSTIPAATGKSERLNVTTGGLKTFANTGMSLTFPSTGTFPNGELASYRLYAAPDVLPNPIVTPTNGYWIVRNFGTNATFSSLTGMSLKAENISSAYIGSPNALGIFKRASNAEGSTWGTQLATASSVTATDVNFTALTGFTSFSQFAIGQVSVPLPVELLDFNAQKIDKQVAVTWRTASEQNVKIFRIKRSTDAINFIEIGTIEPNLSKNYVFYDRNVKNGTYYYQLTTEDNDGRLSQSSVVSVTISNEFSVTVFPNPSKGFINIQVVAPAETSTDFAIYNSIGQVMLAGEAIPKTLDIQHFGKGIYYLKTAGVSVKFVVE